MRLVLAGSSILLGLALACSGTDASAPQPVPALAGSPGGPDLGAGSGDAGAGGDAAAPKGDERRSAGCGRPAPAGAGKVVEKAFTAAGKARVAHVSAPASYDPGRAHAIVLALHGAGDTSPQYLEGWLVDESAFAPAIYVYPQALARTRKDGSGGNVTRWDLDGNDDLAFYDAMLASLSSEYCVDPARVFATGFSSGGNFAQQLGCLRAATLRAFAAVAGPGPFASKCGGPVAAWMTHDVEDDALSIEGARDSRDFWADNNACSAGWGPSAKLPPACQTNAGCPAAAPLVYCETTGVGHEIPEFAPAAIGRFFASFD